MLRTAVFAACFCALALSCAEARPAVKHPHHDHHHARVETGHGVGCADPVMRPCYAVSGALERHQRTGRGARARLQRENSAAVGYRPARYIAGRLVCAINVNAELARRGIRGTGSALAKSFLHWGRASRPVAGAVAVYGRHGGGHVAIVSRVTGGRVYVWNPSSRHRGWREVEYRRRAIAYRVAAQ